MLKLLLDEHIPPVLAEELPRHQPGLEVAALGQFQGGSLRGESDAEILKAAAASGWTLVTYDLMTIPPLLKTWAEAGQQHGGVVFVDRRTLEPSDVGGLIRALGALFSARGELDWTDRIEYLRAASAGKA